jgi:hypothetical protein
MVVVLVVVEFFTKAVRDLFGATEEKKVRAFTESQNTTTFERR